MHTYKEAPNEFRADRAEEAVRLVSDQQDPWTDWTDTLACMLHLLDREGIAHDEAIRKAQDSYQGDFEDGPKAVLNSRKSTPPATIDTFQAIKQIAQIMHDHDDWNSDTTMEINSVLSEAGLLTGDVVRPRGVPTP